MEISGLGKYDCEKIRMAINRRRNTIRITWLNNYGIDIGLLRDPEQRPTEIGAVQVAVRAFAHDGARAVGRTVVHASTPGHVAGEEHPRRGRDITLITPIRGIICCLAPTIFSTRIAWGARCYLNTFCIAAFRHAFYCAIAECYRPFTIIQITAVFGPKFSQH